MFLKARSLELEAKKPIVILNAEDAENLDVKPLDRVELSVRKKKMIAIVNVTERFIKEGHIGLYSLVEEELGARRGERIKITPSAPPESLMFIREKLLGNTLKPLEIRSIISDVVDKKLSDIEITAFITALYNHGMTMKETAAISSSMARTGRMLKLPKRTVFDKHSIGGIPGDKTTMLVVPIAAAAGLTIPKTSSRAITSPAGTADRVECLCPVDLTLEEMRRVVMKTNGCMIWGGAVDFAPADDMFIQIEYVLSIDPLLLPSVLSKKKAVNARYVVIDIPTGTGTKIKTPEEANELACKFIELGKELDMSVACAATAGNQPVGCAVGPALEAREALSTLTTGRGSYDLINKAVNLSSILFDFKRMRNSKERALHLLHSGRAGKKLKEIIKAQGGDPDIKPGEIDVGTRIAEIKSNCSGKVWWISNGQITRIAREAGAPKDRGAGVLLHKKLGDTVKRGDTVFEIYSERGYKIERSLKAVQESNPMGISKKFSMLLAKIPSKKEEKHYFILER